MMSVHPLSSELTQYKHILIAGCGGGCDVYGSIPIYFMLKDMNIEVSLASYTFTRLAQLKNTHYIDENSVVIDKNTLLPYDTFMCSEYFLSSWFYECRGLDVPIYTFDNVGPSSLYKSYLKLREMIQYDAIILIDGGTDSLMFGNESGVGTYGEDLSSIVTVHRLGIPSYLMCVGFGIDHFHGVSHYDVLSNISTLMKKNGYLGCFGMQKDMIGVREYMSAIEYINEKYPYKKSIVHNSIIDALNGEFGDVHGTERTKGSKLFINPLMTLYFCFDVPILHSCMMYSSKIEDKEFFGEVVSQIERERMKMKLKKQKKIPL